MQHDTPSTAWPVTISSPIATTSIDRDTWGKVKSITRGALVRGRSYDANQRLQSVTDPERTDKLLFDYDDAGNLWHVKRNGVVAETRGYDKRNRLTSIDYASGDPSAAFGWWPSGAIKTQGRGSNSHAYTYNARHEIKSEAITTDNGTYKLGYGYDALAHLSSFTYPDNTQIAYQPNALGQPGKIDTFATNLQYYPNGAVKSFVYGNAIAHSMSQSDDGRQLPKEVADAGATDLSYTYDGNGYPLTVVDHQRNLVDITLTYDGGNRLKSAVADPLWGGTTFTYNADDTLTLDKTGTVSTVYTIDSKTNLPSSVKVGTAAATALIWDGEGNLTQKGSGSTESDFTFDTANELTQLVQGGVTYNYGYDGQGWRATRTSTDMTGAGLQIDSVYDLAGRLVYESTAAAPPTDRIFANNFEVPTAATQTTRYVYLGNHAVAKSVTAGTTTTTTYLHTDALGIPVAQTDSGKHVVGTSNYLPYGGLYSSTGTGNVAGLGFASASSDPTGLVYLHARYLDPQLRRFISLDPVGVDDGTTLNFNRLSYATDNPYARFDPSGRESRPLDDSLLWGRGPARYSDPFDAMAAHLKGIPTAASANLNADFRAVSAGRPPPIVPTLELAAFGIGVGGVLAETEAIIAGEATAEFVTQITDGSAIRSGLGDLTTSEVKQIQAVVNQAGRPLNVVGSAARGERTSQSDIDYLASPSSFNYFDGLQDSLPSIDPDHGIISGYPIPDESAIPFEPWSDPILPDGE